MKVILVDLDGVLNNYTGEYNADSIPEIKQGAEEFLSELSRYADLYLYTTRNKILAVKWLIKYDVDKFFKDVTNTKIPCYLHIDDRAICFKGNYNETISNIKNYKAYWKN